MIVLLGFGKMYWDVGKTSSKEEKEETMQTLCDQ